MDLLIIKPWRWFSGATCFYFAFLKKKNDDTVKKRREILELHGTTSWVDSRELSGGTKLNAEIENSILSASHFLVVISIDAIASDWVQREVNIAHDEAGKRTDGYKVISVVLPGVQSGLLKHLFPDEPVHINVEDTESGLNDSIPPILAALGKQLPEDWNPTPPILAEPLEELVLKLTDPQINEQDGIRRAEATAELTYNPADRSRAIVSRRYTFKAPLGPLELDEIRWYIENFYRWPTGVFKERAQKTEKALPEWGAAPHDSQKLGKRLLQLVHPKELATELRACGVPLFYLDACQTAQSVEAPKASLAEKLLSVKSQFYRHKCKF